VSQEMSATHDVAVAQNNSESALLRSIVMATPANVDLEPQPIPQEWVLSGTPVTRGKMLVRSKDYTETVVVWDCTAGSFRWHYSQDETLLVISGEAFLQLENGSERRFGPGDIGFFHAGTTCTWRVAHYIRKVAVVRETMWQPLGVCLKVWKKLLRIVGLSGKAPL
jgi:uncharacterized cupin superfamily protein